MRIKVIKDIFGGKGNNPTWYANITKEDWSELCANQTEPDSSKDHCGYLVSGMEEIYVSVKCKSILQEPEECNAPD